jgi:hypothetical protein
LPIVTEVAVTPVWSLKAEAGIGGVDEPLPALLVEVVEEQAVSSPATSTRLTANDERGFRRSRAVR